MDYHLADAEEGSAKESYCYYGTWLVSKFGPNHVTVVISVVSPPTHSIGIARLAVPGHQLSRSED